MISDIVLIPRHHKEGAMQVRQKKSTVATVGCAGRGSRWRDRSRRSGELGRARQTSAAFPLPPSRSARKLSVVD